MTTHQIKLVVADALANIDNENIRQAVEASKKISAEMIDRLAKSSAVLNQWIQNYGDVIGLSSKQIITADQIVTASALHDKELKSVLKISDLADDVQAMLLERNTNKVEASFQSGPSLG